MSALWLAQWRGLPWNEYGNTVHGNTVRRINVHRNIVHRSDVHRNTANISNDVEILFMKIMSIETPRIEYRV